MDRCQNENLYGYTVHSYYVECPDYSEKKKRASDISKRRISGYADA